MGVYLYGITGGTKRRFVGFQGEYQEALTMKYIGLARDEDPFCRDGWEKREALRIDRAKSRARDVQNRPDFVGSFFVISGDGKWGEDAEVYVAEERTSALWYDTDEPRARRVGWLRKFGRGWKLSRRTRWERRNKWDDEVGGYREARERQILTADGTKTETLWYETVEEARARNARVEVEREDEERERLARQQAAKRLAEQRKKDERRAVEDATSDLTEWERLRVVTEVLGGEWSSVCKYGIREERHGDTETPGGIE